MDKFNDFIFGYTSRIPVSDILEQTREINILEKQKEENKIASPYTIKRKNNNVKYLILYIVAVIILVILVLFIVKYVTDKQLQNVNIDFYNIERRG